MDVEILAFVALSILAFGAISGRVEKTPITAPMVFVAIGLALSPKGLGVLHLDAESELFHLLAELTLVLVLFTDASRIDLRRLLAEHRIVVRMLAIGMPLTILLGALLAGALFDGLGFWPALVLAAILAPTDAALGQAVVSNKKVPVRIRQALNVESGLNDGIALPAVVILISCMGHAMGGAEMEKGAEYWTVFTAKQVVFGPLVGIFVGFLGGKLLEFCQKSGWMNHVFQELSAIGISLAAFSWAELAGGNGFMAAFTAGLVLGNTTRAVCTCLYEFGEAEGHFMTLMVFMVFGAAMLPQTLEHANATVVVYALASLTVVRSVPVMLSVVGLKLRWDTQLFLGWFGPRGIASILFCLLLLEETMGHGEAVELMFATVGVTVLLSVFLHGMSAYPGAVKYAERVHSVEEKAMVCEHEEVGEMPARLPYAEDSPRRARTAGAELTS